MVLRIKRGRVGRVVFPPEEVAEVKAVACELPRTHELGRAHRVLRFPRRALAPIESSFATVKLRTKVTKGAGSKKAALAMAYKLLDAAQERWRRLNGHELVSDVLDGVKYKDGIKVTDHETTTNERVAA